MKPTTAEQKLRSNLRRYALPLLALACLATSSAGALAAVDEDAVKSLLKRNDCTKCHSPTKTKKGPSYKKIAEKYKGDPAAEKKMLKHMTTSPKVKLEDGSEEEHKVIDTKDPKELKNLTDWILSR